MLGRTTVQPEPGAQSVVPVVPDWVKDPVDALQPVRVWSAIWLLVARFTPSTMSISPSWGQFSPFVQIPGHTCPVHEAQIWT